MKDTHPDSPKYCLNNRCVKCCDSECTPINESDEYPMCENCRVWTWRFTNLNHLPVNEVYRSLEQVEHAKHACLNYKTKKSERLERINFSVSVLSSLYVSG